MKLMQPTAHVDPVHPTERRSLPEGKRTRVLHCLWSGEIGGAERAVYQLVREQMRDPELEPALLFAQGRGFYWSEARSLGCPVLTLDLPHGHALRRVPDVTAEMRAFDIHHFHSAEPLLMLASARCRNPRRVYTHRGGLIDYPLAKRLRFEACGVVLRAYFDGFSGNTAHAARSAAKLYRLQEDRFRITFNGLDFELLAPMRPAERVRAELGFTSGDFVLGTVANLKPWKRIERLIDAVAELPELDLRLLVLGEGSDRPRLEERARKVGVSSQVIFAGLQRSPADYLQVMDAFCLPSMGLESFGNAAVEAMALGVPTIVFADGGGLVEHLVDGETGFVVSDQAELEQAVRHLVADPELRLRIGGQAGEAVRERYAIGRAAEAHKTLYAEALELVSSRRRA